MKKMSKESKLRYGDRVKAAIEREFSDLAAGVQRGEKDALYWPAFSLGRLAITQGVIAEVPADEALHGARPSRPLRLGRTLRRGPPGEHRGSARWRASPVEVPHLQGNCVLCHHGTRSVTNDHPFAGRVLTESPQPSGSAQAGPDLFPYDISGEAKKARVDLRDCEGEMKENSKTPKLLTVRDVAEMLQLAQSSVYAMAAAGVLPHLRVGNGRGTIRFRQEDIEQFLESCQVAQAPRAAEAAAGSSGRTTAAETPEATWELGPTPWSGIPMRKQPQNQTQFLSTNSGTSLAYITDHWPSLPPHVREAILTLVEGALAIERIRGGEGDQSASKPSGVGS